MTIPVVYAIAGSYPQDSFTVLTQTFLMPLFINKPPNLNIMGVNLKSTEKSFPGFMRYAFMLRKYNFDKVIDIHDVIRSRLAGLLFSLNGAKVYRIDKGRSLRRALTARPPKIIRRLPTVIERYAAVFSAAGYEFKDNFVSLFESKPLDDSAVKTLTGVKSGRWIGVAPFAKHKGKIYPLDKMEKIVEALSQQVETKVFLFGGRGDEGRILDGWSQKYSNVINTVGLFALDMELTLISRLDALICMDSANMHFASLTGTKVVSIWGATHPYAGFLGYHQSEALAVQRDLPCRPCSIYGNKPCYRGDWACLNGIEPEDILIHVIKGDSTGSHGTFAGAPGTFAGSHGTFAGAPGTSTESPRIFRNTS
jgi:ADP-heptose:LPS heptosyltransferase